MDSPSQNKSSVIGPDRAQQVLSEFASYKATYKELNFDEPVSQEDPRTANAMYRDIARGMSHAATLGPGSTIPPAHGLRSKAKRVVKLAIKKITRPFFRLMLRNQDEVNRQSILLAQAVVALEARVALLEKQQRLPSEPH